LAAPVFRRISNAVATSREGHRSPRSALEVLRRRLDTRLDAAMIFPDKIPISTVIEGRGAQEMVALVLRAKNRSDSRIAPS
jgi:hypothetical protein